MIGTSFILRLTLHRATKQLHFHCYSKKLFLLPLKFKMEMTAFLIFLSTIVSTYAGVGYLTDREELDALRLYRNYCSGSSEGGNAGKTYIYCKKAREDYREDLNHLIRVNPRTDAPRQVVFVQPPSYYYRHKVTLTGATNGQQQAVIYVLPPKNTHTIDHSDLRDNNQEPLKPTLFFLKSDPSTVSSAPGEGSSSSSAITISDDQDTPSNTYPILPTPTLQSKSVGEDYRYTPTPPITKLRAGGYY